MIHFVYLDYGPRQAYRLELKYSFLTLAPLLDPAAHRVAIYTDAPARYAAWPVAPVPIADKMAEYTAGGRFTHRIKPAIVLDALRRFDAPVLLMDSDSIVGVGFTASVAEKLARGAIMNRFERDDPIPELAGFTASLPHATYRYDRAATRMFNSGLVGARPEHIPVIEDALALTDAYLDQPACRDHHFQLEQLAFAEAFRIHGVAIAEIHDTFLHYWPRSQRRYAEWRLPRILPRDWDDLRPPATKLTFNRLNVRLFSGWRSVRKRLPGAA